jgi:hypothetical protein
LFFHFQIPLRFQLQKMKNHPSFIQSQLHRGRSPPFHLYIKLSNMHVNFQLAYTNTVTLSSISGPLKTSSTKP